MGRCRTLFVAKFDLGGGDIKVATINIRNVKLQIPENFVLLLMVMVGRGLLLTPIIILKTQPSHIQSLFNFLRHQHQTLWIMKHSEWWLHIQ